jgi:hypothetical protein
MAKATKIASALAGMVLPMFLAVTANAQEAGESGGTAKRASAQSHSGISDTQRQEVESRGALAHQILDNITAEAEARGLDKSWRQAALGNLLALKSSQLRELSAMPGYDAVMAGMAAKSRQNKVLGDIANDVVFVPVTPCRLIDTRVVGGKISSPRGYDLDVLGNPYGGAAACNIETITGVDEDTMAGFVFNVTIVDTSAGAPGFLALRPAGTTDVTSLMNWYVAGAGVQVANSAIVVGANNGNGLGGNVSSFEILASSPVHVIVDFFGAFMRPQATTLDCTQTFVEQLVGAGATFNFAIPGCPAGYALVGAGCRTPLLAGATWAINGLFKATVGGSMGTYCAGTNVGAQQTLQGAAQCCRIPGR